MPVNSIITQPAANSLNAAYRPIVFKVNVDNIVLGTAASDTFTVDFIIYENKLHIYYGSHTPEFCQAFFQSGFTVTVSGAGTANDTTFTIISTGAGSGFIDVYVRETVTSQTGALVTIAKNTKTVTPSVVFCDVYFAGVFYKTISKTKFFADNGADSDWQFDIQDPCQEVLGKFIAPNGGNAIVRANELMKTVYCKFRSSAFNSDGFITPEDTAPIQGTGTFAAVSGTGTLSNSIYVINSVLQHVNNQDIAAHLAAYKANTTGVWSANSYPLTHRPAVYFINQESSDYYPFAYTGSTSFTAITIYYRYRGNVGFNSQTKTISITTTPGVYYVPNGVKNLRTIFNINFRLVDVYYIQVYDNTGAIVMTSSYNKVEIIADDNIRLHFLTYTGAIDAITFIKPAILHESTDSNYQLSSQYPLSKTDFGIVRSNVKSNDTTTAITKNYLDDSMNWMQELFDSPMVLMEWKGIEGQSDSYIPVTMINGKLDKLKNNGQWEYVTIVQYKLSNEYQTIRN